MSIVGWDDAFAFPQHTGALLFRNSWGQTYGAQGWLAGHGAVPYAVFNHAGMAEAAFVFS